MASSKISPIKTFNYANNDVFDTGSNSIILNGMLGNSGKKVYLNVVVPYHLTNITSIYINKLIGEICTPAGGTLDSSTTETAWRNDLAYTFETSVVGGTNIMITISKSTAFTGGTNHTPVVFYGKLKLTFYTGA